MKKKRKISWMKNFKLLPSHFEYSHLQDGAGLSGSRKSYEKVGRPQLNHKLCNPMRDMQTPWEAHALSVNVSCESTQRWAIGAVLNAHLQVWQDWFLRFDMRGLSHVPVGKGLSSRSQSHHPKSLSTPWLRSLSLRWQTTRLSVLIGKWRRF